MAAGVARKRWYGTERPPCPGCKGRFNSWTWVPVDGMEILTHDGDAICPGDSTFGGLTGPESAPAPLSGVAA